MVKKDILTESPAAYNHSNKFQYEIHRDYMTEILLNHSSNSHYDRPHFHTCFELILVESGELRARLNGVEHIVKPGQFIAISGLIVHELNAINSTRWVFVMPMPIVGTTAKLIEGKRFEHCVADDDGTLLGLLHTLSHVNRKDALYAALTDKQNRSELIRSLCTSVLITAITVCGLCEQPPLKPIALDALQYIHLHFREKICIEDMAKELLCTQQKMSDSFRRVFGMTVNAYINHLRAIDVRANLAEDPDMPLIEAADLSGFGCVRSLLRAYRNEFGCTPSKHRERTNPN
ncbi:MAG: AraC family transcriptional regulator [Clostridia bacterium]|nr:AraC family transcriptional regulator [Clostridia bacterium]